MLGKMGSIKNSPSCLTWNFKMCLFSSTISPLFLFKEKCYRDQWPRILCFRSTLSFFYLIDLIEYRSTFSPIITACMNFIKLDHKSNINRHCRMSYKNTISRVRSFLKCGHGSLKYKVGFFSLTWRISCLY